jgi:Na+-transporting NADH:ubiquinone oxidoreductase subunit NqrB
MALTAATTIGRKFVFQTGDKHFFKPPNFGIISALALTPDAWVSPGQWREEWWYVLRLANIQ